ncbi:MAG TPA: arginine--tRNA ligase [Solirubrobacteraceae bacterium]|nr:arginine--tRNA ligase [Solirubrobacteraceae bacterium]
MGSSPAGRIFRRCPPISGAAGPGTHHIGRQASSGAVADVLDQVLQALVALAPQSGFAVIPLHNPRRGADAQIFAGADDDAPEQGGIEHGGAQQATRATIRLRAAREALTALPDVAAVRARRDSLTVRFADTAIAQLGAQLERGAGGAQGPLDARDLLGGEEVVVNFCDANPTKALHVGHLRNVALGQALAGAFAAAGARVTRQSQVSDYCRSMGEALAGYLALPEHTAPHTLGVKSDHFVGECFGRYATQLAQSGAGATRETSFGTPTTLGQGGAERESPTGPGREVGRAAAEAAEDPALSAEAAVRNDLADGLLQRLSAGDPETVACWRRLREWALRGQETTLASLGVHIDRLVYESDSRPLTRWILDKGLAGGVLTRADGGAVVYETREERYPRLLLARADGFPTQHLRTFALWHSLCHTLGEVRTVELVGEEWGAYVRYHAQLMHGQCPTDGEGEGAPDPAAGRDARADDAYETRRDPRRPPIHPTDYVIYGMVTVEGGAVKSSHGRPPLVDGVLERVAASQPLRELVARGEGRFTAPNLAALVTLGFYLGRPTRKPVDLSLNEMLDLTGGVGWELARAVVDAWDPRHDGPPDPAPDDAGYRHTVMQSQVHRRLLSRAVERLDVYELARFYGHLSRRHLGAGGDSRTARAMRSLLAAGMGALGLPCARPETVTP